MSVHSLLKKRRKDWNRIKFKSVENHDEFLERIKKTLYYGQMPITEAFSLPVTELAAELFSEVKKNSISLERLRLDEASEITWNTCVSPCSFVLALLYLERLKTCNPAYVEKSVPSELFLISLMVASKFLNEDYDVLNCEWAESAGLTLKAVNKLEKDFLDAIDWKVFIQDSTFWEALRNLERTVAMKEGTKRGWFSYTDLELLMDYIDALGLAQAVFTVSAVCLASYAAVMLTVIGSTILATQLSSHIQRSAANLSNTTTYQEPISPPATFKALNLDYICQVDCDVLESSYDNDSSTHDLTKEITDLFPSFQKDFFLPLTVYYMNSLSSITQHLDSIPLVGVMK